MLGYAIVNNFNLLFHFKDKMHSKLMTEIKKNVGEYDRVNTLNIYRL